MDDISQWILDAAATPAALVAIFVLTVIDGLVPALPSESLVIGLAAIGSTTGRPLLVVLGPVAAVAAFIGDNLSYEIGRAVGLDRFRWMRTPWFSRQTGRAAAGLARRVSTAVLAGRFVPGVRVAVGLAAGATGIRRTVYRGLTALGATLWATYMLILGTVGGTWFSDRPVLGILAATVLGALIGLVVDRVLSLLRRRADRQTVAEGAALAEDRAAES
ncbi:DedA family protein [Georgenia alba]|uniref:DedA family protein n=1 Tax=Georgenia alba TaxID=2233858 RepID=A0ABW2Q4V5_9MICO